MYIVPEATQYTHIKVELVLVALSADNLGAVSAKKSPLKYESETRELLGGTKERSVTPKRGHVFGLQTSFLHYLPFPTYFFCDGCSKKHNRKCLLS